MMEAIIFLLLGSVIGWILKDICNIMMSYPNIDHQIKEIDDCISSIDQEINPQEKTKIKDFETMLLEYQSETETVTWEVTKNKS